VAALTLTARFLGTGQRWVDLSGNPEKRNLGWTIAGLAATLIVGVSGSLAALGDTLFPAATLQAALAQDFAASSPWLLRLRGVHPASAVVAAAFVMWLVVRANRSGLHRLGNIVVGLLIAQFVLGVVDVVLLAPTWMQITHLLGADLYWVALVALTAEVIWPAQDTATQHTN
jgi:cytochrome c oxidase assembly protein subunit 15